MLVMARFRLPHGHDGGRARPIITRWQSWREGLNRAPHDGGSGHPEVGSRTAAPGGSLVVHAAAAGLVTVPQRILSGR
jgi:hypothetical protein